MPPNSVEVLEFVRTHHPADYARMVAGEEIGFSRWVERYNDSLGVAKKGRRAKGAVNSGAPREPKPDDR